MGCGSFFATRAGRHPNEENTWPETFRNVELGPLQLRILLVVKTAEDRWLPDLKAALQKAMRPAIGTWALGPEAIVVLNENGVQDLGVITSRRGLAEGPGTGYRKSGRRGWSEASG